MSDNLTQLRARQTELVLALSVENSSRRLAELSSELETLLRRIQEEQSGAGRPSGTPQGEEAQ